ncbi:hypothetical protein MVEG_07870 [Podila verticillata NRRL 6337]|nr:hypothetical protein MVEG_07870 [Podila verticillata NRRL 6337]
MSQRQGEDLNQGPTSTSNATSTSTTPAATVTPTLVNASPENSSPYTLWTVPSLDNLFSARRASAFGLRYNLSPAPAIASGRTSPAPSGMSIMMDSGPSGPSLVTKSRRMSIHMSETINGVLNDSSLVFYRVNEHIHKKVPILVQEKKALANIRKNVETANQDMEDARQTISSMQRIAELGRIEELVNRSLAQVQPLHTKRSLRHLGQAHGSS